MTLKKEVIASGKDLHEAQQNARLALGAGDLDDVVFETIDLGSRGIFGIIGVRPAKVKASMEIPEAEPKRERREPKKPREGSEGAPRRERTPQKPKPQEAPRAPKTAPEKPAAIPEEDLHFEPIDAKPGDDRAFDFINTLIADLELPDVTTELLRCDDGTRRIRVTGESASLLIGHHGDTLDALQYLTNLAASQKGANGERDRSRVTVDVEGYRAKREQTLRRLARRMANKALARGSKVTLEPMTPYERRIIHSEVQSIEGVTTQSIGSDSNRRIVIYPEHPGKSVKPKAEKAVDTEEAVTDIPTEEVTVTETPVDDAPETATTKLEAEAPDLSSDAPSEGDDKSND